MEEWRRWFSEAEWDLETAEVLHGARRFNAAAFYAHQAAEKAVKALLYAMHQAPWGHSVRELLSRLGHVVAEELMTCARELDRHYIPSRSPTRIPRERPTRRMTRRPAVGR